MIKSPMTLLLLLLVAVAIQVTQGQGQSQTYPTRHQEVPNDTDTGSTLPTTGGAQPVVAKKGTTASFLGDPTTAAATVTATAMAGPTSAAATTTTTTTTATTTTTMATEVESPGNVDVSQATSASQATPDTPIEPAVTQPPPPPVTQAAFTQWKLREFDVAIKLQTYDTVETFTDTLHNDMTLFLQQRYTTVKSLDLEVQTLSTTQQNRQQAEDILHYTGSTTFDATGNEVVHAVQIWKTQQDFLEVFLVETRRSHGVLSIRLDNGIVIGETAATTTTTGSTTAAPPTDETATASLK